MLDLRIPANDYEPHRFQRRVHASGARFLCCAAGVRAGKTYSGVVEFARRIYLDIQRGKGRNVSGVGGKRRRPSLHYWIVAPTAALLNESWRYLFEVVPHELISRRYEAENTLWLHGNVLIEGKSAENPLHLVSAGLDGMLIDEAARIKPEAWRGQLRQRLSDHDGWALFTTTPLGRNWFYEEIFQLAGKDEQYQAIKWRTIDNPTIPEAEIEAARRQLPRRYFEREYEASFDAFLGTIYDEWRDETHITSEEQLRLEYGLGLAPLAKLFRRVVAGVDWGWNSPGAIMVMGDTGRETIILDESYASHRPLMDIRLAEGTWVGEAKRLLAKWHVQQFFADPGEPGNIFDFSRHGIPVTTADNEVLWGIRKVAEALHPENGRPRLRVLSRCENLIREIKAYVWDQNKKGELFKEVPAPNQSDHALDALRYGMVELARYASEERKTPYRASAAGPLR